MNDYIYTSEIGCLLALIFVLFMMLYTRPKRTKLYCIDFFGVILSISLISLELFIGLAGMMSRDDYFCFDPLCFSVSILLFLYIYLALMCMTVLYISQIAKKRRVLSRPVKWSNLALGICYIGGSAYLTLGTNLLYTYQNNVLEFTNFTRYYAVFGLLGLCFSLYVTIRDRKEIPKLVFVFVLIFMPFGFGLLLLQAFQPEHIFTGITVVFPFIIFYILFHSNPYDDITGTQNAMAFENRYVSSARRRRKFMVMFIDLPQLTNVDFSNLMSNDKSMVEVFAETCRQVEQQHPGIGIYRLNSSSFGVIFYYRSFEAAQEAVKNIHQIVAERAQKISGSIVVKSIAFAGNSDFDSEQYLLAIRNYLSEKIANLSGSRLYIATPEDKEKLAYRYRVEQTILDIRNRQDLNDDRVLVYAQPIFSVEEQKYKTAEALMRLTMDGKIVYPDVFIPIAEQNRCIHTLTLIILNKVCAQVHELMRNHDFEAVTVNFSSSEFSDPNLHKEVLDILEANQVPTSYIRIELTESAIFDNFDIVLKNMDIMREKGIEFYLDDYGTGYSNLERIMDCPFYTIKFDKSLLYKAIEDGGMNELMSGMIKVFREKGFHALVEGVEDESQRDFAVEHGFQYIQGYHYAKPQEIARLADYFEEKKQTGSGAIQES